MLAFDALYRMKEKRRNDADHVLHRPRAIPIAENKARNALTERGVQARKKDRERLYFCSSTLFKLLVLTA